ncbi:MAG: AAA family ATPase [Candidatus Nanoarchaeia archaeon]|nr:AAA family ATPase [Candidatus Nanoarchaeia archaeon]
MKIAVTGTHSSGKTTLAKRISNHFNIPFIRGDKAKEIFQEHFPDKPINELSVGDQWKFQQLMFQSFDEVFKQEGDCVTDGFHLTCLPYSIEYTHGDITQIDGYFEFLQKVIERSKQFDLIFYLPPELSLENDNFRPQDKDLRITIDKYLFSLLQDFNYCTISGPKEVRIRKVGQMLGIADPVWENYIAFEGLPKSGKSIQISRLQEKARQLKKDLYICKRSDNEYIKTLRERSPERREDYNYNLDMLKLHAEILESEFESNEVKNRLADGQIVVSERQKFTALALYGALGIPRHLIYQALYELPDPGRTIYLDINPCANVIKNIRAGKTSSLKSDLEFQEEMRKLYLQYAKDHRLEVIEANQTPEQVFSILEQKIFGASQ